VELVSVERMIWSGEATIVLARTTEGELGVLPGHAPLLGQLADGGVAGNLDRLVAWAGETAPEQPPRHGFGVMQPDDEAIDALLAWFRRRPERPAASFVPIIGHFECRDACMVRMRAQPAQLRP